ncbi:MAG: hypothetical protein VB111_00570 [Clostridiaceae bacterium]|nr:hypothetical protein [Clostridiaceae bacterium]
MSTPLTKERLYYRCPTPQVLMAAEIEGEVPDKALKAAIAKVFARHELLHCKVVEEAGTVVFAGNASPREPEIIYEEGPFTWNAAVSAEERRIFRYEEGELCRFRVYPSENGVVLLCSGDHLLGDGMSFVYLFRDILTALGNPSAPLEPMPIRLCDPKALTRRVKLPFAVRLMSSTVNRQWKRTGKTFSYADYEKLYTSYWGSRATAVLDAVFEPDETAALIDWCHANGVTVNSALAAAFLLAAEESSVGVAVNVRDKDYEGLGNFATGVSVDYFPSVDTGFDERARELHALLYKKLDDPQSLYFLLKFMDTIAPSLIDGAYFNAFGGYEHPIAQRAAVMFGFRGSAKGVNLTNLTKLPIPTVYGAYRLKSISFVPPLVPGSHRLVGAATLDGRMCVTMHYDQKEDESMRSCFTRAIGYLKRQTANP